MSTFHEFVTHYPRKVYQKGQTILLKGDEPRAVCVIESGMVKTYAISQDGNERLVTIIGKQEDFPVAYTVGLITRAPYFYEAFNRCVIRFVPREDYVQYLRTHSDVLFERHMRLAALLSSSLRRIETLEYRHATDKVVGALIYVADMFNRARGVKSTRLNVSMTQQEIADLLGLSRETTNVEIKKLEQLNLLKHTRQNLTLYVERLRKYRDQQA